MPRVFSVLRMVVACGCVCVCVCAFVVVAVAIPASADDDDDSDLSRVERRKQELFLEDDVLDPSFPMLEVPMEDVLRAEGNSDSVSEEPLDPDPVDDEIIQKILAGEQVDETERDMGRDHFDDATSPFQPAPESLGEESRDPVEW